MDNTTLLLNEVLYYSLFHKNIDKEKSNVTMLQNSLPNNAFGVFSTIRRYKKLNEWPIDIHGCIGYWDNNYNTLNKKELYKYMFQVSYDSMYNDDRKNYFDSIENDPWSNIEIDFMLYPVYDIDNNGFITDLNEKYDNNKYGIIAEDQFSNRATYLPNVFDNISWKELESSIKNKAGVKNNNVSLYAYKVKQLKKSFIDLITDNILGKYNIKFFCDFLLQRSDYSHKFPFPYEIENNTIIYDDNEHVRNISTMSEVINYNNLYPGLVNDNHLLKIKAISVSILKNLNTFESQELSFLGNIIKKFSLDKNSFCEKLAKRLRFSEEEFEKPEIVIGLTKAGCQIISKNELLTSFKFNETSSVFKINWSIQAIIALDKNYLTIDLVNIFIRKLKTIIFKILETNYLAVIFEALCYVLSVYSKKQDLKYYLFNVLFVLEQRKNNHSLYEFLDGTSRIDITGHTNNGFLRLYF